MDPQDCKHGSCSELDQIQDFIRVNLSKFTGPNFTEVLHDVQLVERDVNVLGLPSPLSSCGLGVLRCLDESLAASSGCGQLPLLGRL